MSTVYILYSKSIDQYYIGSCLNLEDRLEQHNNHVFDNSFTRRANDWVVFFKFENLTHSQSMSIEAHIKRMKSRKYLNNLRSYPEISEKLVKKYVGSSR